MSELLHARGVVVATPGGRTLIRDLTVGLHSGDRVAVVGRNGVGKSSLLHVLSGETPPSGGRVVCCGTRSLVRQQSQTTEASSLRLASPGDWCSPGEAQRQRLAAARASEPDLLLLDEPTHDLDADNIDWLLGWIGEWRNSLIVVSHNRKLMRCFRDFFIVEEAGCRHFHGSFDDLIADMARKAELEERRYVRNLNRLLDKERHNAKVRGRRQRKKNLGRIHELRRCPSRGRLNENRSYAQESQGKRAVLQRVRIGAAREWARVTRQALSVDLPLELAIPTPPEVGDSAVVTLRGVAAHASTRVLFEGVDLLIGRDRLAVTGANGSGKSTLVEILTGNRAPDEGWVHCNQNRLGYVAQNSANWCTEDNLVERMVGGGVDLEHAAQLLRAHKFPLALAERSLAHLSPGERLRAALICLCLRSPTPELLVLDEPTDHLDFLGLAALEEFVSAWPGGLVIVSHDQDFLNAVGVDRSLNMDNHCQHANLD